MEHFASKFNKLKLEYGLLEINVCEIVTNYCFAYGFGSDYWTRKYVNSMLALSSWLDMLYIGLRKCSYSPRQMKMWVFTPHAMAIPSSEGGRLNQTRYKHSEKFPWYMSTKVVVANGNNHKTRRPD